MRQLKGILMQIEHITLTEHGLLAAREAFDTSHNLDEAIRAYLEAAVPRRPRQDETWDFSDIDSHDGPKTPGK